MSWIETGNKLFGSGGFPQEAGIAFVEQITEAPKATFTLHTHTGSQFESSALRGLSQEQGCITVQYMKLLFVNLCNFQFNSKLLIPKGNLVS